MIKAGINVILILSFLCLGTVLTPTTSTRLIETELVPTSATLQVEKATPTASQCEPLPASGGNLVTVSTVNALVEAVNELAPNTTILIADGVYHLQGDYLWIETPNVTIRSASGNREAVVLDGDYQTDEIITIAASDVTVADLTLQRAFTHPIHVVSTDSGNTENTLIYNLHIIDPREQAIKINPHSAQVNYTDHGTIACSHIQMTDAGRSHVSDCYTGGVDAHMAIDWIIRDNLIEGFWCPVGLSEHAIHMWRGCRDTIVERNILRDNARGIGFGMEASGDGRTYPDNPCPSAQGGYVDHYGGIIRNNFVFVGRSELFNSQDGFDCGICLWQACGAQVLHNTVASTQAPFSSIEWRFDHTNVDLINNLVTHNLRDRGGVARLSNNLENQPLSIFVNGSGGDLHLTSSATAAIDHGQTLDPGLCDDDIDGEARPIGTGYDIGADEIGQAWLSFLPLVVSN